MDAERTGKRGPHQADTPPRVGNYVTARVGNYVTDNPSNLGKYVTADTKIAGRSDALFADDAMTLIHNASRGHPRAVNNLALHALTAAFAAGHSIVGEKAARIAISETATD